MTDIPPHHSTAQGSGERILLTGGIATIPLRGLNYHDALQNRTIFFVMPAFLDRMVFHIGPLAFCCMEPITQA